MNKCTYTKWKFNNERTTEGRERVESVAPTHKRRKNERVSVSRTVIAISLSGNHLIALQIGTSSQSQHSMTICIL